MKTILIILTLTAMSLFSCMMIALAAWMCRDTDNDTCPDHDVSYRKDSVCPVCDEEERDEL